jgi:hypothetical protein
MSSVTNRPKIAIALVSHDNVPVRFAYDLANMVMVTSAYMPEGTALGVQLISGTYVHSARQEMLESLIGEGVTHILWVDTDMTFPPDSLIRLLEHNVPVVGINYSQRGLPPDYVAIKKVGLPGEKLATLPESTGLEEVDAMGMGLMLTRIDGLRNLPAKPWFAHEWLEDKKQWLGEDVYFCGKLREAGVKLLVDHDLSKECGHLGQFDYRLEGVAAWKAGDL